MDYFSIYTVIINVAPVLLPKVHQKKLMGQDG